MSRFPKANKDLRQHFLTSPTVIEKICTDFADVAESIVEIGPGPAVLTPYLAKLDKPLILIEMDTRFEEKLRCYQYFMIQKFVIDCLFHS